MAIQITTNPGEYNLAYGSNAVVLSGIVGETKYVLRVKNTAGDILADVRQTPNRYGQALFDIQNILQTYVSAGDTDVDTIGGTGSPIYRNTFTLGFDYVIDYGSETNGVVTIDGSISGLEVYPGRKEYYETDWNYQQYQPTLNWPTVGTEGLGLTDNPSTVEFNGLDLYDQTVRLDDWATVSYLQQTTGTGIPAESGGLAAFKIELYQGQTLVDTEYIFNIAANGGGPYNNPGDIETITYPWSLIQFGAGPQNLAGYGLDLTGVTHYTVTPHVYDASQEIPVLPTPAWKGHKFTIDQGICLDYDPIQFSWMNSFGTRDYFTFTKKNEKSVRINRNTYLQNAVDYNGAIWQIDPTERGLTVYSQQLDQEYVANTDYISDEQAQWLESLFVSPDVRVRLSPTSQWLPVVLTSSSYTQKTFRKDRLFQYELRFKLAHGLKSQRG